MWNSRRLDLRRPAHEIHLYVVLATNLSLLLKAERSHPPHNSTSGHADEKPTETVKPLLIVKNPSSVVAHGEVHTYIYIYIKGYGGAFAKQTKQR